MICIEGVGNIDPEAVTSFRLDVSDEHSKTFHPRVATQERTTRLTVTFGSGAVLLLAGNEANRVCRAIRAAHAEALNALDKRKESPRV